MILRLPEQDPPKVDEKEIDYIGYYSFLNRSEARNSYKKRRNTTYGDNLMSKLPMIVKPFLDDKDHSTLQIINAKA